MKKMFNVTNHQGNANQNHKISSHIFQNDYQKCNNKRNMEKRNPCVL